MVLVEKVRTLLVTFDLSALACTVTRNRIQENNLEECIEPETENKKNTTFPLFYLCVDLSGWGQYIDSMSLRTELNVGKHRRSVWEKIGREGFEMSWGEPGLVERKKKQISDAVAFSWRDCLYIIQFTIAYCYMSKQIDNWLSITPSMCVVSILYW